jgi:F420-0:gamma-glutamyl ligase
LTADLPSSVVCRQNFFTSQSVNIGADLYGHVLEVTQRAVADNIASAAVLVMGEADESVPCAIVRGLGLPIVDEVGVPAMAADECLFMGLLASRRPGRSRPCASHVGDGCSTGGRAV